jgi:hypothetical protein
MFKIKLSLIAALFSIVSFAQTGQIISANSLFENLKAGKDVSVIIHYAKCKLLIDGEETQSPDAIGGMKLMPFEYFAKMSIKNENAYVTASETRLISHRSYGYVLNYVKIRISEDDSVEIIARYLDPNTYEVKMDETFKAMINKGGNDGAVYLWMNN